jgi:hypothetical protein
MNVTDAPRHEPFKHYCHCGKWASFGYGVKLRAGVEGKWSCREHCPRRGAATANITITITGTPIKDETDRLRRMTLWRELDALIRAIDEARS